MEQTTDDPASAEVMRSGIAINDRFVMIDDPNDPGTIHCIPKQVAIAALRLIAVSSPRPKTDGNANHGRANE
jgi:hypothetical protein